MAIVIDRTKETAQSAESRKRFLERTRNALIHSIRSGDDQSVGRGLSGNSIYVNSGIEEPFLMFDPYVKKYHVVVKNKAFEVDDVISIDDEDLSEGNGSSSGDNGNGSEEPVEIYLSQEEFSKLAFEDMELPNFVEKDKAVLDLKKFKHAGFTKYGLPSNLNIVKSFKESFARRIASRGVLKEKIGSLEVKIKNREYNLDLDEDETMFRVQIVELEKQLKRIPYFDETDLRYNTRVPMTKKIASAVVFLCLDVSGSMTGEMREAVRRLYYMVSLFLRTRYQQLDIVFIRHTEEAEEVSEEKFFYSDIYGGTAFIPTYKLVNKIIEDRYNPNQYNIYVAHASDGDCFDEPEDVKKFIAKNLVPKIQFGFYVNVSVTNILSTYRQYMLDNAEVEVRGEKSFKGLDKYKAIRMTTTDHVYSAMMLLFGKKEKLQ